MDVAAGEIPWLQVRPATQSWPTKTVSPALKLHSKDQKDATSAAAIGGGGILVKEMTHGLFC